MKTLTSTFLIVISLAFKPPGDIKNIISGIDNRPQPEFFLATMTLQYKDSHGNILNTRKLKYWRTRKGPDSESVLIKFIDPPEVKNTAFMSIAENENYKQFIFLPSLGKIRAVKKVNLNSSFMNSDFFYSDLKSWKLEENQNQLINETDTHLYVESVFRNLFLNQRLLMKINKETYFIEEVLYFNKDCDLPLRKMIAQKVKEEAGIYFSTHFKMIRYFDCSEKVRSSSEIIFTDWDIKNEIDDAVFTDSYMVNMEF